MQYFVTATEKHRFIVTPDELRLLLAGFHHIITNAGVHKSYVESDPDTFLGTYEALYAKLKAGEKLVWEKDYNIAGCSIGITHHLQNCIYLPTDHLHIPNFLEPCPVLDAFCFTLWKEQLSTSFSVQQFPENICGLCLHFPSRIDVVAANCKHQQSTIPNTELDDFPSYQTLLASIQRITKPLKLEFNGRIQRPKVRISDRAKKDVQNFYFIASNDIAVL